MAACPVRIVWVCVVSASVSLGADSPGELTTADKEAFFESSVRPLLIARCTKCHGAQKQESGLRLDLRESLLKGGDRGPAILEDNPLESLLLEVVNYRGDLQMPPREKLPDDEIAVLTTWVRDGCVMPADDHPPVPALGFAATPEGLEQSRATHWAYQPLSRPPIPTVRESAWSRTAVDRFVLAAQEAQGLTPSTAADRRTLIRRMTFDLIGLPPTLEDV